MNATEIDTVLEKIHCARTLLIDVATGKKQIRDTEQQYVDVTGRLTTDLARLKFANPNEFLSLWDWYSYWKQQGLTTYADRRNFINTLYAPVIANLQTLKLEVLQGNSLKEHSLFSSRFGYVDRTPVPISLRDELPTSIRRTVVDIVRRCGWGWDSLYFCAAEVGRNSWEPRPGHLTDESVVRQIQQLVETWPWYFVLDFVELACRKMNEWKVSGDGHPIDYLELRINDYFAHTGVGWQLRSGKFFSRETPALERILHQAGAALGENQFATAEKQIQEALAALSRRPNANVSGAIYHAKAAIECVLRTTSGDRQSTLGKILNDHPGLIPKPLDIAVEQAWGFASERGRHLQEGKEPSRAEAELVVGLAATVVTYLVTKINNPG